MRVGEILFAEGSISLNEGKRTLTIWVENRSKHPVWVSSHYHFFEVNRRLHFDRAGAYGMRLDIPAGRTVRFDPGERKEVRLVEISGRRELWGFNHLTDGPASESGKEGALERARKAGFLVETGGNDDGH